jgi:ArsR family transcriptional regulator
MTVAQRAREGLARSARKNPIWNERARLLRVVAHPVRLMILQALSQNSRCVKDLNSLIAVSQPHLSQHMAALRRAKLVDCHSSGTLRCYYVLQPSLVGELLSLLVRQHAVRVRSRRQVIQEAGHVAASARNQASDPRRTKK